MNRIANWAPTKCFFALLVALSLFVFTKPTLGQSTWWETTPARQIGPYWIKTDIPSAQANAIGRHLNLMRREYDRALVSVPVRVQEKLNVLVFQNRADCEEILQARYGVTGVEQGGLFVVSGDHVLAFWIQNQTEKQIERLMQREGFRQFAYNRFGADLPVVLEQGLAELFGEAMIAGDTIIFGQSTPQQLTNMQQAFASGEQHTLAALLTMNAQEWMSNTATLDQAALLYRQARAFALFMLRADTAAYARYIRHLNNGLSAEYALARSYAMTVDELDAAWRRFVTSMEPGAVATALQRLEFLAEGMLELHRRGIMPVNLEEVRTKLREIGFNYTVIMPREDVIMTAAEDAPFVIPRDENSTSQPVFVLNKARAPATRKERDLEQTNPTPPTISTQHLRPVGMQVRWIRTDDNKSFRYELLLR